jgi:hypothetical protein
MHVRVDGRCMCMWMADACACGWPMHMRMACGWCARGWHMCGWRACLGLGDDGALELAQVNERRVLRLLAQLRREEGRTGEDAHVLKPLSAHVAKARCLHRATHTHTDTHTRERETSGEKSA